MSNDDFWSSVYSGATDKRHRGRFSAMRLALLFGMAAMALALIVPPMFDVSSDDWQLISSNQGIDFTTTATTKRKREYTIQRSILQSSSSSVCIIQANGRRSGDC
ncbi:hypothetical protein [Hoeflea sp. TYP-13]|uniref:hypothetical protein n=1 Tax=Hoeflea sp. TYP-13 TaxID=3230023 RepID=UPI0034C62901